MLNWIDNLQNLSYKKIYSQRGQDGIIEFIFNNIGITNKFCVEFGFNTTDLTGGSGANVARLILEDNWTFLLLDRDYENLNINLHKELLTFENIGDIFKKHSVPQSPDYVSIDVDSIDLWLFKGILMAGYRPRLISVEYNCRFLITASATVKPNATWGDDDVFGASLLALQKVAEEFGYHLIYVESECDAFFIRDDIVPGNTNILNFAKFTMAKSLLPPKSPERAKLLIQYPSLEPFIESPFNI